MTNNILIRMFTTRIWVHIRAGSEFALSFFALYLLALFLKEQRERFALVALKKWAMGGNRSCGSLLIERLDLNYQIVFHFFKHKRDLLLIKEWFCFFWEWENYFCCPRSQTFLLLEGYIMGFAWRCFPILGLKLKFLGVDGGFPHSPGSTGSGL